VVFAVVVAVFRQAAVEYGCESGLEVFFAGELFVVFFFLDVLHDQSDDLARTGGVGEDLFDGCVLCRVVHCLKRVGVPACGVGISVSSQEMEEAEYLKESEEPFHVRKAIAGEWEWQVLGC
jgi:hypothetical protein